MTFDDFKKRFEIFSKIDTAEKLAVCESQYENHILHLEDENYFEPVENDIDNDVIRQYEKNLNSIFCLDTTTENHICFLVQPSFEPEQLLILEKLQDKTLLTLTTLIKNYWTIFHADHTIIDTAKKSLTTEVNKTIGDKLFNLLDNAIMNARQSKIVTSTLDGTVYRLSKLANSKQKIVFKHSPGEISKSGKIIGIMQYLIDNIEFLDGAILLDIETKIQNLQD